MRILLLQRAFLALLVAASLYGSAANLLATRELGSLSEDPVAEWEQRFEPLKRELPFVRGIVGYISDADVPGISYDAADEAGEYVLTQYALAPIIIVRGTDQEWNVANLSPEAFAVWSAGVGDEFVIQRLNRGLYLARRLAQ